MNGRLHKQNFFEGFIVSVGNKIHFDSMHIFIFQCVFVALSIVRCYRQKPEKAILCVISIHRARQKHFWSMLLTILSFLLDIFQI